MHLQLPRQVWEQWAPISGAASGMLALIGGFVIYWWQRRDGRKAITYSYSLAEITSQTGPFSEILSIRVAGVLIEDATIVSVTIRNSGSIPIRRDDFDGPLSVSFKGSQDILAFKVAETVPKGLSVQFRSLPGSPGDPSEFTTEIDPLLMNDGDEFTLFALVSGFRGKPRIEGRIAGVKQIEERRGYSPTGERRFNTELFRWMPVLIIGSLFADLANLPASARKYLIEFGPMLAVIWVLFQNRRDRI